MIQIYTGSGKGKTTAAIGQAVRAAGAGMKVGFYQFLKGGKFPVSEEKILKGVHGITCIRFDQQAPVFDRNAAGKSSFIRIQNDLAIVYDDMLNKGYNMMVLDELTHLIDLKLANEAQILEMLGKRPKGLEVVITGRQAPKALVKAADLVTEMKEIKHPFRKGVKAKKGIEF
jgi:cob(I)alamin adenosyltransferase